MHWRLIMRLAKFRRDYFPKSPSMKLRKRSVFVRHLVCGLSALMFGARGAVPATGNIAPALLAEIYNAFQRGDLEASKAAQLRLNPLRLALALCTAPGAVKAALKLLGTPIGPCRSPIADLAPEKAPKMRAALQAAGLLK